VAWGVAPCGPDLVRGRLAERLIPAAERHQAAGQCAAAFGDNFYEFYFQEPGVAERKLEGETAEMLLKVFYWYTGDAPTVQT
jgi:hypothetical protein